VKKRTDKVSRWELIVLALVAIGLFAVMMTSKRTARSEDYEVKSRAAGICEQAFAAIRDYRIQHDLAIDEINDPNRTGLIGSQYSLITAGRGDQTGAMTTTNPNFVAVCLTLLREARLKKGDVVAVGLDGSLPSLNVEVLAACTVLALRPVVISTVSSSMWGANDPMFTWLDMEAVLNQKGILPCRSLAASLGGDDDNGRGLSPAGRARLDSAIVRNQVSAIVPTSLEEAVARRLDVYRHAAGNRAIRAFVNVGNAVANLGAAEKALRSGIVSERPEQMPYPSVMRAMAEQGAVLLNFHDPSRLAYRYRFPVAPVPLPALAKGRMFVEKKYPVGLAIAFALIIIVLLFFVIEIDLDFYLRRLLRLAPPGNP
jgi:poly-gamma-glutamate system protein